MSNLDELAERQVDPLKVGVETAVYRFRPEPGEDLWTLLRAAVTDAYVRRGSKASRNYPRKKNEKPAGKPILEPASRQQIKDAKELKANEQANQLTA